MAILIAHPIYVENKMVDIAALNTVELDEILNYLMPFSKEIKADFISKKAGFVMLVHRRYSKKK